MSNVEMPAATGLPSCAVLVGWSSAASAARASSKLSLSETAPGEVLVPLPARIVALALPPARATAARASRPLAWSMTKPASSARFGARRTPWRMMPAGSPHLGERAVGRVEIDPDPCVRHARPGIERGRARLLPRGADLAQRLFRDPPE